MAADADAVLWAPPSCSVWMHTGSINGMSAIVGLLPNRRFGVVVLINRDHAEVRHALMYRELGGQEFRSDDMNISVFALKSRIRFTYASEILSLAAPELLQSHRERISVDQPRHAHLAGGRRLQH